MSRIVVYRQYWMAMLKERHNCHCCGELAINAFEFLNESGICQSLAWHCDELQRIFGLGVCPSLKTSKEVSLRKKPFDYASEVQKSAQTLIISCTDRKSLHSASGLRLRLIPSKTA